jgi:LemA protein
MEFLSSLFHFLIFIAIVFVAIAWFSYNKLQRFAQNVKEKNSNIQIALSKKISEINQLMTMVKGYQDYEQFTQLKVSSDSSPASLVSAYQESGAALTAIQMAVQRFPELQASGQYHRILDSIQNCEFNIQSNRQLYTQAVKEYNSVCLSIPTVFVARLLGFPPAPYLEFDSSGLTQQNALKEFKTDDGERLNQLLGSAGSAIANAGKNIMATAGEVSKKVSDKMAEQNASHPSVGPRYFYLAQQGGVPQGPATLEEIRSQVIAGKLPLDLKVAAEGTADWVLLSQVNG